MRTFGLPLKSSCQSMVKINMYTLSIVKLHPGGLPRNTMVRLTDRCQYDQKRADNNNDVSYTILVEDSRLISIFNTSPRGVGNEFVIPLKVASERQYQWIHTTHDFRDT